jgi:hypothetical protein
MNIVMAATLDPGITEWLGFTPQQWTLAGLLGVSVMMILTGFLRPRPDVMRELKEVKADRDHWKEMALSLQETTRMLAAATKENTEPAKAVAEFVSAMEERLGASRAE